MSGRHDHMLVVSEHYSALVVDEAGQPVSVLLANDNEEADFADGAGLMAALFVALQDYPDELHAFLHTLPKVAALASEDENEPNKSQSN